MEVPTPTRRSLRLQGLQPTTFNLAEYILRTGAREEEVEEEETDEELYGLSLQEIACVMTAVEESIVANEGSIASAA